MSRWITRSSRFAAIVQDSEATGDSRTLSRFSLEEVLRLHGERKGLKENIKALPSCDLKKSYGVFFRV